MFRNFSSVFANRFILACCAALMGSVPAAADSAGEETQRTAIVAPVRLDPDKLGGVGLPLGEAFIPPEDVIEGRHRPRGEILYSGEQLIIEIYEDDAATFSIPEPFPIDEFVLILDGKLILTDAGGQIHEFVAGDSLVVPKGFTGTWKMLGNYRELVAIERTASDNAN